MTRLLKPVMPLFWVRSSAGNVLSSLRSFPIILLNFPLSLSLPLHHLYSLLSPFPLRKGCALFPPRLLYVLHLDFWHHYCIFHPFSFPYALLCLISLCSSPQSTRKEHETRQEKRTPDVETRKPWSRQQGRLVTAEKEGGAVWQRGR